MDKKDLNNSILKQKTKKKTLIQIGQHSQCLRRSPFSENIEAHDMN